MNSVCQNAGTHKTEIQNKLDSAGYDLHDSQVNDGKNLDGDLTLGLNIRFNVATECTDFYSWLTGYLSDNKSEFSDLRIRVHECYHASDENLPCKIGDVTYLADL